MTVHEFKARIIDGAEVPLSTYEGKVLLIVNVASQCALTPQYGGLEQLYEKYREQGLCVLGFPCNQFGAQEPGGEAQIKTFCETSYGVKFPMFAKIDVNGPQAHPLYQFLTTAKRGFLGTRKIKWNFTKFLVDRKGNPVKRYAPQSKPAGLEKDIKRLLAPFD